MAHNYKEVSRCFPCEGSSYVRRYMHVHVCVAVRAHALTSPGFAGEPVVAAKECPNGLPLLVSHFLLEGNLNPTTGYLN